MRFDKLQRQPRRLLVQRRLGQLAGVDTNVGAHDGVGVTVVAHDVIGAGSKGDHMAGRRLADERVAVAALVVG